MNGTNAFMDGLQSRILIIDTSVAKAAGGIDATAPLPKKCRDFLSEVFEVCHKVGFTEPIQEEWDRHVSRFTSTWLTSMQSHGKRKTISSKKVPSIRKSIDSASKKSDREAMKKDVILIEASLAAHELIVSLDDTVRNLFQGLSGKDPEISDIVWINPAYDNETVIEWLNKGAPNEKERTFDYRRKKNIQSGKKGKKVKRK